MSDQDLKTRVADLIRAQVAPALAMDVTGIEVVNVSGGIAQVRFSGACASCPSTVMTLIMGLEQELRARFPEIEFLEALP
jgi:Fe-S cluster biogenesis protein NfuA